MTCVFFHAHPDDEALLTAGTMARLAAEGHRVVLVVATAGEAGLTASGVAGDLGAVRLNEVRRSAELLGCDRVVCLGYADSGQSGHEHGFSSVAPREAAERLACVLREERAHLLTSYDPRGGYGHPDHLQVNRVASAAAALAGTPVLLESTVDRRWYALGSRIARLAGVAVPRLPDEVFSSRSEITHRVNVRAWSREKRASMRAHASQTSADSTRRTLAVLLALPRWVFRLVLGTEWYVRRDLPVGTRLSHPLEAP